MQDVPGVEWHQHGEVGKDEQGVHPRNPKERLQAGPLPHVAEALAHHAAGGYWPGTDRWGPRSDQAQAHDHRQEAGRVAEERRGSAPEADHQRRGHRPDDARAVEGRLIESDRLGQLLPLDELRVEGLEGRQLKRHRDAEKQGDDPQVPELQPVQGDQRSGSQGQDEQDPLDP